ncbi:hypothetical protein IPA_02890 [Ignicoccus pacificus DSM 13166]|uniref:Uncharacterized protein n=1 Tax=Ignicoccus pacificus DSM 13166 TaxID=940294 RepID=A0A977K9A6_9CREN|nr:hypothetical protein IPA_02890 [Ignicoccus pacificus DSM 13166]
MAKVIGFTRLQTLYRRSVGLDIDKAKAIEIIETAEKKLADLFDVAFQRAEAEGRDYVTWKDLPITKGLAETMERFERKREELGEEKLDLGPIAEYLSGIIDYDKVSDDVKENLPKLVGTLLVLEGYIIKLVDPGARRPSKEDLERARQILDLTL